MRGSGGHKFSRYYGQSLVTTESTFSKKVKLIGQTSIGQPQVRSSEEASGVRKKRGVFMQVASTRDCYPLCA
jgi:hypothetical protein